MINNDILLMEAPSNQTNCVYCRKNIKKGEMRLNIQNGTWNGRSRYAYYCLKCAEQRIKRYIIDIEKELNEVKHIEKEVKKKLKK